MKRFLCSLLLLCLVATVATAQIRKGDGLLYLDRFAPLEAPLPIPAFSVGGGLYRDGARQSSFFTLGGSYGRAIADPVVVGVTLYTTGRFGEFGDRQVDLLPFLRYYPLNTTALMAYAEVSSGVTAYRGGSELFKSARVAVGVHLPVGAGALVTPNIGYQIREGNNSLLLGAGLQLLVRDTPEGDAPVATFSRGTLMLGAENIQLTLFEDGNNIGADVGGHFFLSDGFAVAGLVGYQRTYSSYSFGGSTPDRYFRLSRLHLGAGARYYLTRGRRLVWYGEAGVGRVWESLDTNVGVDYLPQGFTYLTAGVGGQYFLTRRLAVEAGPQLRYDLTNEAVIAGMNFGVRWLL